MILFIDNYDSFVYILAHYFQELDQVVKVFRNDELDIDDIVELNPVGIVISPGPCGPLQAGISLDVVKVLGSRLPILGVCLGHQCIGEAYGGKVVKAPEPVHGRTSQIYHNGKGVFLDVPSPFTATRYHSLVVSSDHVPEDLEVTAWTKDGLIMGFHHRETSLIGLQFHPESILTQYGHQLLKNFLSIAGSSS